MQRSLFTKIIDREIPATIEYEDDRVIAIRDIAPVAPVHILIIPKKHLENVNAIGSEDKDLVGHVFEVARQLATKFNISESGYRVVTNVNSDGGQSVPHLHYHLLGGEPLGHMTSGTRPQPSTTVQPNPPSPLVSSTDAFTVATFQKTFWRDFAIMLVAAIGLAYGYNELNPKHIQLVRPVFTRDTLADNTLILPNDSASGSSTASSDTSIATGLDAGAKRQDSLKRVQARLDSIKRAALLTTKNPGDTTKATPSAPCFEAQSGVIKEIKYEQFVTFLSKPCVVLIDARIPETYAKGHIGNAMNINGTEAESPDVIQRLIGLPRDKIVLIYCDGGECELSHRVADVLKNFGYGPIYIYTGGWAEWSKRK